MGTEFFNEIIDDVLRFSQGATKWVKDFLATVPKEYLIVAPIALAVIIFILLMLAKRRPRKNKKSSEKKSARKAQCLGCAPGSHPLSAEKMPAGATVLSSRFRSLANFYVSGKENIMPMLKTYLSEAEIAIEKTGGALHRGIDGGFLADWGISKTTGDYSHDALNAVRAALGLRIGLMKINKERYIRGEAALKSISGISTSPILEGKNGGAAPRQLIGECVLFAEKTREMGEKFDADIIITSKTWRLIEKYIIVEEIDPLYKENNTRVRLFAVINLRAGPGEAQPHPVNLKELQVLLNTGVIL